VKIKLPHLRLPADLGSFLDKIILDLYRLSKPSTAQELKEKDSSLPDPITIGRALSYLDYLGIVRRTGGKGVYELTDEGRKIGVELYQDNRQKADEIWKVLLEKHQIYSYIKEYIQEKGGGVRGSSIGLAEYLRDISGEKWKTAFLKAGGARLCNLFASKGLLKYDEKEDEISLPMEGISAPPVRQPSSATAPQGEHEVFLQPSSARGLFNVDIQLKIEITKDTSPELAEKVFNFLLKLSEKGVQTKAKT